MRVLITGHTGFKGSWLSCLLKLQGHELFGFSIDADSQSLYCQASMSDLFATETFNDIGGSRDILDFVEKVKPHSVFHFAAQPLVRVSYEQPLTTFMTNVMGTVNLLEAIRRYDANIPTVVATTDKVYANFGQQKPFVEDDSLGGWDPYSASKASADIAALSYIRSYRLNNTAVVRAGNVIGGGDWSKDRLIPDVIRSLINNSSLEIRYPEAVRPWQHVLDCLNGYLTLSNKLHEGGLSGPWNFGPSLDHGLKTVREVVTKVCEIWGMSRDYRESAEKQLHESNFLMLDSNKARTLLGWSDRFTFQEALEATVLFYRRVQNGESARAVVFEQVESYLRRCA